MLSLLMKRKFVRERVTQLRERLFRTAYAWSHNRALADDLVQETALKALENVGQLRDADAADAWVFTIMANCHRSHLRRAGSDAQTSQSGEDVADDEVGPERLVDRDALVKHVRAAVGRLNDEQRKVLTLVDLEGFSYAEVASVLGVPVGTVMSRLSRARQRLKTLLRPGVTARSADVAYLRDRR